MINIFQNKNITVEKMNSIKEKLWKIVSEELITSIRCYDSNGNMISKENILKKVDFELTGRGYSLKKLFSAKNEDFDNIRSVMGDFLTFQNIYKKKKKEEHYDRYEVGDFFTKLYDNLRKNCGTQYIKDLELTVCPYCNRNYIDNGNEDTIAELDHFLDKKDYPWLAITLENLIPCCSVCNHLKGTDKILCSPYDPSKRTDEIIEFSFIPASTKSYDVIVSSLEKPAGHSPMEKNINTFKLDSRYKINAVEIKEMVAKYKCYSKDYLDYLKNMVNVYSIELSPEEVYYGSPLSQDKYYTRPLSKFRKDILDQIKSSMNI